MYKPAVPVRDGTSVTCCLFLFFLLSKIFTDPKRLSSKLIYNIYLFVFLDYSDQNQAGTLSNHSAQLTICQVWRITGCNRTQSAQISFCSSQAPDWMTESLSVCDWSKEYWCDSASCVPPTTSLPAAMPELYTCSVPVCAETIPSELEEGKTQAYTASNVVSSSMHFPVVFNFEMSNIVRHASFWCSEFGLPEKY